MSSIIPGFTEKKSWKKATLNVFARFVIVSHHSHRLAITSYRNTSSIDATPFSISGAADHPTGEFWVKSDDDDNDDDVYDGGGGGGGDGDDDDNLKFFLFDIENLIFPGGAEIRLLSHLKRMLH